MQDPGIKHEAEPDVALNEGLTAVEDQVCERALLYMLELPGLKLIKPDVVKHVRQELDASPFEWAMVNRRLIRETGLLSLGVSNGRADSLTLNPGELEVISGASFLTNQLVDKVLELDPSLDINLDQNVRPQDEPKSKHHDPNQAEAKPQGRQKTTTMQILQLVSDRACHKETVIAEDATEQTITWLYPPGHSEPIMADVALDLNMDVDNVKRRIYEMVSSYGYAITAKDQEPTGLRGPGQPITNIGLTQFGKDKLEKYNLAQDQAKEKNLGLASVESAVDLDETMQACLNFATALGLTKMVEEIKSSADEKHPMEMLPEECELQMAEMSALYENLRQAYITKFKKAA